MADNIKREKFWGNKKTMIAGFCITAFWFVMMGLLFKDYIISSPNSTPVDISPSELTLKWENREEWMRILLSGKEAGFYVMRIRKDETNREYRVVNRMKMKIGILGQQIPVSMDSSMFLREDFILNEFIMQIKTFMTSVFIHGLTQGTDLLIRWNFAGKESFVRLNMNKQVSLYNAIIPVLSSQGDLRVGKTFQIPAFDPIWESVGGDVLFEVKSKEQILLNGKEFETFKVETTLRNLKTISYVLSNGNILRQELPYGIILERMLVTPQSSEYDELKLDPKFKRLTRSEFLSKTVKLSDGPGLNINDALSSENLNLNIGSILNKDEEMTNKPSGFLSVFSSLINLKK